MSGERLDPVRAFPFLRRPGPRVEPYRASLIIAASGDDAGDRPSLSTVIRADHILVLDSGCIVDQGRHAELLERSEVHQRLYKRQFEDALATTGAPIV